MSVTPSLAPRPALHCLLLALFLLVGALWSGQSVAQDELYFVRDFREIDKEYIRRAQSQINERLSAHTGTRFRGDPSHDIALLQRLLDEKVVRSDEIQLLQAMGVILGEAMRSEYPLDWIRFEDASGTSRALQFRHNEHFIFPITAISRRASVGLEVNVQRIYRKLLDPVAEAYQR